MAFVIHINPIWIALHEFTIYIRVIFKRSGIHNNHRYTDKT